MFIMHPVTNVPDELLRVHKQWERGLITLIILIRLTVEKLQCDAMEAINVIEKITTPINVFFKTAEDANRFVEKFKHCSIDYMENVEPPDGIVEKQLLECKWTTVNVPSAELIDYLRENAKPIYTEVCGG
jgi:hypothetical protein